MLTAVVKSKSDGSMNMTNYEILKDLPYRLEDDQVNWVKQTLNSMTDEEKIGQLFCLISYSNDENYLEALAVHYKVGGVMGRAMSLDETCDMVSILQSKAKIPLLIAANLEAGGDGLVKEGTCVGPNMQIAATGDPTFAAKQGTVCAKEGLAVGANWAFAPVIDIDMNFRNPITTTRTYGSDINMVEACGVAYTRAAQSLGMAVSIKHFPGDGVDERDQHLVTSINSLSCEEWDESYGKVYKASIDAGALTVMAGHIMQPNYSRKLAPGIKDEDIMPATLAPELLNGLLRERLGFNGMIVTDATTMAGMTIPMERSKSVPYSIAAGCDMFLFAKNLDEDIEFMKKGLEEGILTHERLNDAVMRILGVKAALKLNEKAENGTLMPNKEEALKVVGCLEHKIIQKDCSDQAVTLVKDIEGILPLNVNKHKKVLLYDIVSGESFFGGGGEDIAGMTKKALEKEGFEVTIFKPAKGFEGLQDKTQDMLDRYDLLFYVANMSTKSNQTTVRIEWALPMGANCPSFQKSIPTLFVSFANPYHLIDVPRIRTFVNAYKFNETNLNSVIDKLMGRTAFKGTSPSDPFCGMWDTRL